MQTMKAKSHRLLAVTLLALLGAAATATAQAQDDSGWQWSITPYLWATDTTLDLSLRGTSVGSANISFSDLLDIVDTSAQVNVEAGKGNWSVFGDFTYLDTFDSEQRDRVTVDTDSTQVFVDLAASFWPGGVGTNLSLYGGLRYTDFDDRYTFKADDGTTLQRRNARDYYDLLVGARYRFELSERWALLTRADASFGDSEGTWLVNALFAYTVGKRRSNQVIFGYQFKRAEYKDANLGLDFSYKGPMAGFNFRF